MAFSAEAVRTFRKFHKLSFFEQLLSDPLELAAAAVELHGHLFHAGKRLIRTALGEIREEGLIQEDDTRTPGKRVIIF